ncbi:MAG: hypothetical protein J6U50_08525 [Lachnospiraceae bacterium]|nr:hypothetical protein [Lachnospiraceae bacterium]
MKRKIFMILMCSMLSFSMITGCGGADTSNTSSVTEDEDDRDSRDNEEDDKDSDKETDTDKEEDVKHEEDPEETVTAGGQTESMPRSDAYEKFLAGEMDLEVVADPDDQYAEFMTPAAGTYSYDELKDAVLTDYPGDYDVKYALFQPSSGSEGDDILVLYFENQDPSFYNWIGFAAYENGSISMKYTTTFGYRSFFDLYFDGYILCGGSGGAGAQYLDCMQIQPDSSAKYIYKSAHLYASWCDEISYWLDEDMNYNDRPHLTEDSALQIQLYKTDDRVMIEPDSWSDNKAVKDQEEAFVSRLEDLGAMVVSGDVFEDIADVPVDENKIITWNDIETISAER